MSDVLATLTEQLSPVQKRITLLSIPSISGTKTVTMQLTKKQRWRYLTILPLHIYGAPHWPSGVRRK